jgi:ABC-type transport system involved in multi-copper enzyme maturation permease subunit
VTAAPLAFLYIPVPDWARNWLTPLWLVGVGAILGLLLLAVLWGIAWAITRMAPAGSRVRREVDEIPMALRHEVLLPLSIVVLVFAFFGLFGALFAHSPLALLSSLARITSVGQFERTFEVPPTPRDELGDVDKSKESVVEVELRHGEIRQFRLESNRDVVMSFDPPSQRTDARHEFRVPANDSYEWKTGNEPLAPDIQERITRQAYIANESSEPATVKMIVWTAPAHPEVTSVLWTAGGIVAVYLLYFLQRALAPRLSAIALATYKSAVAQPLFPIILCVGAFVLLVFVILPYNTFGEDIKILKDTGFTLIMVLSLFQAIWAASTSVSEEIEGRTALTVLSKPIRRYSFVLGKYVGICWTVALIFVILGAVFFVGVAYKPLYDAREASQDDVTWQLCNYEMVMTTPGLILSFMQTLVLAAISVAISTRLLTPVLVERSGEQFEIVRFFAQLIATVLPNLESFNITAAVAADAVVPLSYLAASLLYCILYSIVAMLLALFLFEDRDLA